MPRNFEKLALAFALSSSAACGASSNDTLQTLPQVEEASPELAQAVRGPQQQISEQELSLDASASVGELSQSLSSSNEITQINGPATVTEPAVRLGRSDSVVPTFRAGPNPVSLANIPSIKCIENEKLNGVTFRTLSLKFTGLEPDPTPYNSGDIQNGGEEVYGQFWLSTQDRKSAPEFRFRAVADGFGEAIGQDKVLYPDRLYDGRVAGTLVLESLIGADPATLTRPLVGTLELNVDLGCRPE